MIIEWITAVLLVLGAAFMLIAGIGVLRLPDTYLRMHAATKAPSLGVFLMVLGIIVNFQDFWLSVKGLLIIVFIFMTTPIGAHMLSRVAHLMGVNQSEDASIDEFPDGGMPDEERKGKRRKG